MSKLARFTKGTVLKLLDFGAIVSILPGRDGLLHISQIANERVNAVADYLKEGQKVRVKVLEEQMKTAFGKHRFIFRFGVDE